MIKLSKPVLNHSRLSLLMIIIRGQINADIFISAPIISFRYSFKDFYVLNVFDFCIKLLICLLIEYINIFKGRFKQLPAIGTGSRFAILNFGLEYKSEMTVCIRKFNAMYNKSKFKRIK